MFFYGMLVGAGALALTQNLFDYRIDEVVIEYVYSPVRNFVSKIIGVFRKK